MAPRFWEKLKEDVFHKGDSSLGQKAWAYKRGFFADRIPRYGLEESNVSEFLEDFSYLKMHPINGIFSAWIDDKLTLRYVFCAHKEFLPGYFFYLDGGRVLRLPDAPAHGNRPSEIDDLLDVLIDRGSLAMKPAAASRGEGFCKLDASNSGFFINDRAVAAADLVEFLRSLSRYIVTEYLISHPDIRRIYDVTPNTLRLMVIHDSREEPRVVGAFMRFGSATTGRVDNASAGGLVCGVDLETGELFRPKQIINGRIKDHLVHPDSGSQIAGVALPKWHDIKEQIIAISAYYPQLVYMGSDVVITETGFRIIEINSHQDIRNMQMFYPLMSNTHARRFFQARQRSNGLSCTP